MPRPQAHVFVCQNERPAGNPRGSCLSRGSKAVLDAFKQEICDRGLRNQIEFDGTTCIDCCALGPAVVVYPANTWYGNVTPADVPALVDAVLAGEPLDRLVITEEAIRKS
jgi:(2Fe-2S) ferredoxin